jgi:hypothetical protein
LGLGGWPSSSDGRLTEAHPPMGLSHLHTFLTVALLWGLLWSSQKASCCNSASRFKKWILFEIVSLKLSVSIPD